MSPRPHLSCLSILLTACILARLTQTSSLHLHPQSLKQSSLTPQQVITLLSNTTFHAQDGSSDCPRTITHAAFMEDTLDAVFAVISFQNITVTTATRERGRCTRAPGGFLSVGSQTIFQGRIEDLPATSSDLIFGLDSKPRRCRVWETDLQLAYIFSQDISTFLPELQENGFFQSFILPTSETNRGRLWMLSFPVDSKAPSCLFKEGVKPTPVMLEPSPEESAPPPIPTTPASSPPPQQSSPFTVPQGTPDIPQRACFPASATVTLEDGRSQPMQSLHLGDRVMVQPRIFSQAFLFTHHQPYGLYPFLQISLQSGDSITVTAGHFIYINGKPATASAAHLGDTLQLGNGSHSPVVSISHVYAKGLFNPQTLHGDIIVDNVRASTYTTAVQPSVAHALLSPLRAIFLGTPLTLSFCHFLANSLPRFTWHAV